MRHQGDYISNVYVVVYNHFIETIIHILYTATMDSRHRKENMNNINESKDSKEEERL